MFDQMKCFIALVEARSFTKAAENLNMSQSSLSQKIKNLAVSNNLTLLTHHGRSFELTRAGEYFYQHSKNIVDDVEKLVAETKLIEKEDNGIYTLRIGYLRKFGTQDYLRTVNEFSKKYPDVEIQIASGSYQQLFEMIQNDQIDINFSDSRQDLSDRYQNQYLATADYMVAVSTKSFLNYSNKIDTTDLVDLPCILVAGVDDFESERTYYREILGIASPLRLLKVLARLRCWPRPGRATIFATGGRPSRSTRRSIKRCSYSIIKIALSRNTTLTGKRIIPVTISRAFPKCLRTCFNRMSFFYCNF